MYVIQNKKLDKWFTRRMAVKWLINVNAKTKVCIIY